MYFLHEMVPLYVFLMAYNFANGLKTLKGKSPYDFIRSAWELESEIFKINPQPAIEKTVPLGRVQRWRVGVYRHRGH